MELTVGHLEKWHEVLGVVGEQRVVVAGDGVAKAVGDGEGKGLEPGGAALWLRDEEDVVGARLELLLHDLDALHGRGSQPTALIQHPETLRLWNNSVISTSL
mgnify:CR=1 FL=1